MHFTIEEAAQYIVEKLYPAADVHYDFEKARRQELIEKYRDRIQRRVLGGSVAFYSPHTKKPFPATWLSEDQFPHDGLLHMDSLSSCVEPEHWRLYPMPISKAPPPINPIGGRVRTPSPVKTEAVLEMQSLIPMLPVVHQSEIRKIQRIEPQGGDALTPVIWEICYDMLDAGKEIKPRHVMHELRLRAGKGIWPLVGVVKGGVKFEFEKGEEDEIDNEALRKRIDTWREVITGG